MDNSSQQKWKDLIDQHIRTYYFHGEEMKEWYAAIDKMASDEIVNLYQQSLSDAPDDLLNTHVFDVQPLGRQKEISGEYNFDSNMTVIDQRAAMLFKLDAVLTTIHEGVHFGQARVNSRLTERTTAEQWCLDSAYNIKERNAFGINTQKSTYIRSKNINSITTPHEELRIYHYRMQFVERQAREKTIEIGASVGLDVSKKEASFREAADWLKAHYCCHNMPDDKFFSMLDDAQMRVMREMDPVNSIQASMMYDIVAMMHEQEIRLIHDKDERNNYLVDTSRLFEWDNKAKTLSAAGFDYCHVIPYQKASQMDIGEIASFDQLTRDQSPLFMIAAMHEYGEAIAPYINKDSFDAWYFAHNQHFSEEMIMDVVEALGERYANIGLIGVKCTEEQLLSCAIDGELLDMDLTDFYLEEILRELGASQDEEIEIK